MSRRNPLLALAALVGVALSVGAPPALAAGPSVTYTVSSGTAGKNGWYVSDVTTPITVTGATKTTCPAIDTFSSSSDSLDCTATDGTSTVTFHLQFKIDKDLPIVTGATPDRGPNANGWYSAQVTVTFAGNDATSGIASCTQTTYSGPDSGSAAVTGTCTDNAGNVSDPFTYNLKYDSTPPSVTASAARPPDANGWYNHAVGVTFNGSDSTSGIDSCTSASYSGPDSSAATVQGTCTDKAGNLAGASLTLEYDATPPTIKAALARPPDANGWYNHAVTVSATGTDAASGIDTCTGGSYSGPDSDTTSLTAACVDKAGNSTSQVVTFKYDDTPPKVSDVTVASGNGTATLKWTDSGGVSTVTIRRTAGTKGAHAVTVYKGDGRSFTDGKLKNGTKFRYELSVVDQAGNVAKATATALPRALSSPAQGQTVKRPPLLRWSTVSGADYYNVQLFFAGHKVLSAWPLGTKLKLPGKWTFGGKPHTLSTGGYRWYVWPGYGSRKAANYGKLLGSGFFLVR
jgi:hypothetical protein